MLKRIRAQIEERRISGLSKGLRIADKYLQADMTSKQLSVNAGAAHAEIHMLYENGEITWAEREAAIDVLRNHYEKMWRMATFREKLA